ncbi:inositol monophosphatase [Corynebacterium sp. USCH3]|uniref:inositol monophosphatase family protein n=2 Tax=Corynebacterium sp. USCH3 TaxID=3024840 RepID=UPI0030A38F53
MGTMTELIRLDRTTTDTPSPAVSEVLGQRSPENLRQIAVRVAAEAAVHVRDARARAVDGADCVGRVGRVAVQETKSSDVDPVTAIDRSSERLIRRRLRELTTTVGTPGAGGVPDAILGEEDGGALDHRGVTWVVDPVDGTVNLVYGIPSSAVSIAACVHGAPVAGAVADIAHDTVYSACSGSDLVLTVPGHERVAGRTTCSDADDLSSSLVGTGFSYRATRRRSQAELLLELLPDIRDIRRMGSAALDLCAVATGALDGYYEHGLGAWDHAAGSLIAARSGAVVYTPPLDRGDGDGLGILAAAPGVVDALASRVLGVTFPSE